MSLVPGLSPNIRLPAPAQPKLPEGVSIEVEEAPGEADIKERDENGRVIRIKHPDGTITISTDGSSLETDEERKAKLKWYDNLADVIDGNELSRIAEDLLRGIEADQQSREEWLQERANGLRLLGLKIELPGLQGAADGAPVEGMSKVRHPLLQEAVLRFQANARSELLPTDGPVKIRNDNNNADLREDQGANALETDLNHYLTVTATEYYPDTDRMLFMLGFGGTAFKKVYFCPIRNRPVSESVDAEDVIVNQNATDLRNAKRVTHRVMLGQNVIRRLQIMGVYRDVELHTPMMPSFDAAQQEKKVQQGLQDNSTRPEDRDHEILECYCELDIKGFEHKYKGKTTGLEVPYCVTIDKSTKTVLSITRNYDEDDQDFPTARARFAQYTFVPGLGFYGIGLVHILGNTTNALTAAWRELLDAGMYACFPGFLYAENGQRLETNIFRIAPGSGAPVKTGGMDIRQSIMPLPYNAAGAPALMSLVEEMAQTGMRVGGTSEQQVGEGRADAPVGTTLAMIEQAVKVLNAVHKRMHAAQAEEFRLLVECFKDHPESFWQKNKKTAYKWDEQSFIQALEDNELTPQADPNTASSSQRIMKIMALKQLQQANPSLYDPIAIDTAAMQAMGWSNPQQFFAPPQAQAKPPPELEKMQAEAAAQAQESQAKLMTAQAKVDEVKAKSMQIAHDMAKPGEQPQGPSTVDQLKAEAAMKDADTRAKLAEMKRGDTLLKDAQAQEDRVSREKLEMLEMAKELVVHPEGAPIAGAAVGGIDGQNPLGGGLHGGQEAIPKQKNSGSKAKQLKAEETRTKTVTRFHPHADEKPERKARGLGGAVVFDQAWENLVPQSGFGAPEPENKLENIVNTFSKTVEKLTQHVQELSEDANAEREIVRDDRGRIVKVKKVRRPKKTDDLE